MKEDNYSLLRVYSPRYKKAAKKQKGIILTEVVSLTGYHRKHARKLLLYPPVKRKFTRNRSSTYLFVLLKLRRIWVISNFSCGKILVPAIPNLLEALIKFKELKVTRKDKKLLLKISPATCMFHIGGGTFNICADTPRVELKFSSNKFGKIMLQAQAALKNGKRFSPSVVGSLKIGLMGLMPNFLKANFNFF